MITRLKHTPGIYLFGWTASARASTGRILAQRMGWRFCDLEEETESLYSHVRAVGQGRPSVLALCDRAFTDEANRELILMNGLAIWLDCAAEAPPAFAYTDVRIALETDRPEDAVDAILAHPMLK